MNTRSKILKKISFTVSVALMASQLIFSVSFAQSLSCEDLNDPTKSKDWIIVVIEEQITSGEKSESAQTTDAQVLDCMRVTENCPGEEGKTCSSYKALSGSCPGNGNCNRVQVLLSKSGTALLYSYIGIIYRWAAAVIGIISVLFLTWGGIEIASSGDSNRIDTAKQRIIQSLAGLALLLLSGAILYTINPNFFQL